MSNKSKNNKSKVVESIIGAIIVLLFLIFGTNFINTNEVSTDINKAVNKITAEESQNVVLEGNELLQIHFFDQRTTNMIPIICRTFERNPLILGNI